MIAQGVLNKTERQATLALLGLGGEGEDDERMAKQRQQQQEQASTGKGKQDVRQDKNQRKEGVEGNREHKAVDDTIETKRFVNPDALRQSLPEKGGEVALGEEPDMGVGTSEPSFVPEVLQVRIPKKRKDFIEAEGQFDDAAEVGPVILPPHAASRPPPLSLASPSRGADGFGAKGPLLPLMSQYNGLPGSSGLPPSLPSQLPYAAAAASLIYPPPPPHSMSPPLGSQKPSQALPSQAPSLDAQQQKQLYEQQQRRHHVEAMLRAHLALQQLPPPPGRTQQPLNHLHSGLAHLQPRPPLGPVSPSSEGHMQPPLSVAQQELEKQQHAQDASVKYTLADVVKFGKGPPSPTGSPTTSRNTMEEKVMALRKQIQTQAMLPPIKPGSSVAVPTKSDSEEGDNPTSAAPSSSPDGKAGALATVLEQQQKSMPRRYISTKLRYQEYTPPSTWAELSQVPKMKPIPPDDDMTDGIRSHSINTNDVLLGRGGMTNTNPGNIKFRELVAKYRMAYCTAPKGDKGALARYLCNFVRSKEGRFLRKEESNGMWYEVGDEKAVSKCGQALREGTAALIRRAINDNGGGGGEEFVSPGAVDAMVGGMSAAANPAVHALDDSEYPYGTEAPSPKRQKMS